MPALRLEEAPVNRTPLKRKTPLARSVWKRTTKPRARTRRKSKYARRPRAPESWWIFVKGLDSGGCSVIAAVVATKRIGVIPPEIDVPIVLTPCDYVLEADHDRADGLGRKSKDHDVWTICKQHHRERTDHTGAFKAFTKADMRAFRAWAIARTHRLALGAGVEIPDA